MNFNHLLSWIVRIVAAVIMLQTLFFKFSGAEESIYIFTEMGIEPWGRIVTGIIELIAALLLFYRPTLLFGAILGLGVMSGALLSHLTVLGIEVQYDGGQLFIYALLVWVSCVILIWMNKKQLVKVINSLKTK